MLPTSAATLGITVNATNVLSARYLPSAVSGTQVIRGPAWRENDTTLGFQTFTQGYEQLVSDATVNLDWNTGRIKGITLLQNTVFAFTNSPSSSTNAQQMIVEVAGDAVQSVTFTGVSWQTSQVSVPASGVVTRYEIESIGGVLTGYVLTGGSGGGGGAVQVFGGYYGGSLPTDVPTTSAASAYDLDSPHTLYMWDGIQWF